MVIKKYMEMRNKRGWLRIIEAFIAILIVFGAVLYIVSKQNYSLDSSSVIYEKETKILDIISKNDNFRQMVLDNNNSQLQNEIKKMVPASWNFSTCIESNITLVCSPQIPLDRNIYVNEVLITSSLTQYNDTKLRLFVWMK
ncbi:hypothetical protein J4218_06335 [Candidatus Pacearchaeota archaeon]|nr:hypothetical protein [Candidatus Pacearchaeota archaeon]